MHFFQKLIRYFINSLCYAKEKNPLLIKAWVEVKCGKLIHRNWGDELNIHLLKLLTGRPIIVANTSLWHMLFLSRHYICIGSVLGWYENEMSEIWGAGSMGGDLVLRNIPAKIHLVRGKHTRQLLIQQGVNCPENYGDPALLLSQFYSPHKTKKYKMGIIPHYMDEGQTYLLNYANTHNDVCLISMSSYDKWTDVIDQIYSCEFIISSSLHGLIVSDSYGIPNLWVTLSGNSHMTGSFKYKDYFSSVNRREDTNPIDIRNEQDLSDMYNLKYKDMFEIAEIDFSAILESCPFVS